VKEGHLEGGQAGVGTRFGLAKLLPVIVMESLGNVTKIKYKLKKRIDLKKLEPESSEVISEPESVEISTSSDEDKDSCKRRKAGGRRPGPASSIQKRSRRSQVHGAQQVWGLSRSWGALFNERLFLYHGCPSPLHVQDISKGTSKIAGERCSGKDSTDEEIFDQDSKINVDAREDVEAISSRVMHRLNV